MAVDVRAAAAARARQKAQESQSKHAGKGHLKTDIPVLEPKDKQQTMITVIPYIVTEKHHPEGIAPGEMWYKRPYKLHGNLGGGDEKYRKPCPNTFNPRIACNVCYDISQQVNEIRGNRRNLTEKELKEQIENATTSKAKNRELYLIFNHEDQKIYLLDQAYGGGNMVGFGMLLESRIINPRETEWAAFFLPDEYGMALDIQWRGAGLSTAGGRDWIKAISIDFIPRAKAPVPDWVWAKQFDLSNALHHTTVKEIDDLYFGYSDGDEGESGAKRENASEAKFTGSTAESDEAPPPEEEAPEPEDDMPPDLDEDDIPFDPDFGSMNKEALLKFAEVYGLMYKDKPVYVAYAKTGEADVRKAISIIWKKLDPRPSKDKWYEAIAATITPPAEPAKQTTTRTRTTEAPAKKKPALTRQRTADPPPAAASGKCPDGGEFGKDFSDRPGCNACPEELYTECAKANG